MSRRLPQQVPTARNITRASIALRTRRTGRVRGSDAASGAGRVRAEGDRRVDGRVCRARRHHRHLSGRHRRTRFASSSSATRSIRIREFDPLSQRSVRDLKRIDLMARLFHSEDEPRAYRYAAGPPWRKHHDCSWRSRRGSTVCWRTQTAGADPPHRCLAQILHSRSPILRQPVDRCRQRWCSRASHRLSRNSARDVRSLRSEGYNVFMLADGEDARRRMEDLMEGECDRAADEGTPLRLQHNGHRSTRPRRCRMASSSRRSRLRCWPSTRSSAGSARGYAQPGEEAVQGVHAA